MDQAGSRVAGVDAGDTPRPRRWPVVAVAVVVFGWLALAGVTLLLAQRDIRQGLQATDAVRENVDASAVLSGELLPDLRRARSRFDRAHARVSGPLVAPLRVLPVAGRQLRSVSALSGAATQVTDVAIRGVTEAQPLLEDPGASKADRASSMRSLGLIADRANTDLAGLRFGPREALLPPLARARNRFTDQVGELRVALGKAAVGAGALADILAGPRRYLLFAANNAEMRAGSGMFLSAGELESSERALELKDVRTVTEIPVPAGAVPLTGDLADRWGWLGPNVEWRNLMASPRFDAAAPLAADMWVAAGNAPVDGVIALDPVALRGMLAATGPIDLDGRRVDADNVEEELLNAQYHRFPDAEETSERREELGRIARAVFASLNGESWSLSRLATGLARAGSGRHLVLWSRQPAEQKAWKALGIDGALAPDSLLLSVLNRGGNKLDYFLHVAADLKVAAEGNDTEVTVTMRFENRVPLGEPRNVAGPARGSGVGEGVYLGIVTLDVPGATLTGRFDGIDELVVAGADGPCRVMGFALTLERGAQRSVVARFRLPGRTGSLRVEPSARRPEVRWTAGSASWTDGGVRTVTWSG
jgi:hypothetical protein